MYIGGAFKRDVSKEVNLFYSFIEKNVEVLKCQRPGHVAGMRNDCCMWGMSVAEVKLHRSYIQDFQVTTEQLFPLLVFCSFPFGILLLLSFLLYQLVLF